MYVVIFKAQVKQLDAAYLAMTKQLRELALGQFNCAEFLSVSEGEQEVALSYWNSLEDIRAWKAQSTHLLAQERGRSDWYRRYQVQIAEIQREYAYP